jgi:small subunit ribosomal protein S9
MSKKVVNVSGSRKRAIARATVKEGTGKVRINGVDLSQFGSHYIQMKIMEAFLLAGDATEKMDVLVRVEGGGVTGQADAIRLAIGRGIVAHTKSEKIRKAYLEYDRQLLVADVRRKEASKPNCRGKARAKRQKSYR